MKTLTDRVRDLTKVMGSAGGSLSHLACMEADAVAAVILTSGDEDTATSVIVAHVSPDELYGEFGCNDDSSPHRHMYPLADHIRTEDATAELNRVARAYVRQL